MKRTALITGASGGIGRALAHEFARHGYDLVLIARNPDALDDVRRAVTDSQPGADGRPVDVHVIAADLARPNGGSAIVGRLQSAGLHVDVLVNNAGFGLQGEFAELTLAHQLEMLQLNVTTLTELTRLLLPPMLARRAGGVLNVASLAAFQPGPLMSVYYATKAYVLSFTEGIAEEVAGSGLKVSCLCPGPTASGFATRAAASGTNLFTRRRLMPVEDVAREGFDGWNSGRVVVIPGFGNRQAALVVRILPRAMMRRIVKGLNSQAES